MIAIEAVEANAMRLCQSAIDFGHLSRVHIINNAVSSSEGNITLATKQGKSMLFKVGNNGEEKDRVTVFGIVVDSLLDLIPWKNISIKVSLDITF